MVSSRAPRWTGGAYERPKVEGDEADKAGIGCGKPPVGERTPAGGGGVELAACLNLFSKEETLDAENGKPQAYKPQA